MTLEPKYNLKDYYAVTIQPNDKLQFHGKKPFARIIKSRQYFYTLLQECSIPHLFIAEVSEPSGSLDNKQTGGRIHYHGIIKFNKKKHITQWLLEYQYKLLRESRIEVSKIADRIAWDNYIHKQNLIPVDISCITNWDVEKFMDLYREGI